MVPSLLALFPLGSEVRQFGHSGLLAKLLNNGWEVTVAARVVDDDLRNQLDARVQMVSLPRSELSFAFHRVSNILDKAHARKEKKLGRVGWQYKASSARNWKEWLIFRLEDLAAVFAGSNLATVRIAQDYEMRLLSKLMTPEWSSLISRTNPDAILVNGPKARGHHPALLAASRSGVATTVLYHTWKDVAVAGRVTPVFARLGVWNKAMQEELLRQNPTLDPKTIEIVGCGHFDCVGRNDLLLAEPEFRKRIGVNPGAPLLLYIASAPWLIPKEERYIRLLRRAILEGILPKDTQVIVRTNPMDNTGSLQEALRADLPQVVVAKPNWRWDPKINWCFQRRHDLLLYNSLLKYSSACIGIPSTATVECAIADLPTINIGFDLAGPIPSTGSIRAFWDADFYQEVRTTGAALLANNPEELVSQAAIVMQNRTLGTKNRQALVSAQLGVRPHHAASCAADLLSHLADKRRKSLAGPIRLAV